MQMPNWAPEEIVEWLNQYMKDLQSIGNLEPACDGVPEIHDMWKRLLTRPEMEKFWSFLGKYDAGLSITSNGGLLGTVNNAVARYKWARRISPTTYKEEMNEIACLAECLARKLRNFDWNSNASWYFTPFPIDSLMSDKQLAIFSEILNDGYAHLNRITDGRVTAPVARWTLPSIDQLLDGLAARAKEESFDQFHRLQLPKKVNGATAFRTYLAQCVADWTFKMLADYSPTRIATFCSVALDDPLVTPDIIRKVCPLSADDRAALGQQVGNRSSPED